MEVEETLTDQRPTRVAFPPLGGISVVAEGYFRALGLDVVSLPPTSRRSLDAGIAHCPEMLCVPCKLLFGNYLEAARRGADTIITLGGPGTCRLGYSAEQQAKLLTDMGYDCQFFTFDLYHMVRDILRLTDHLAAGRPITSFVDPARMLFGLLELVDEVETLVLERRPREVEPGATDRAYAEALCQIDKLDTRQQLDARREEILHLLHAVPLDSRRPVLKLGLVGDMYTILTPFLNLNLERELARLRVEAVRWFRIALNVPPPLPFVLRRDRKAQGMRAGSSYLARDVGGFARATVNEAALMAQGEVAGLIHVAPFNCTPEIVAQSALVALQRDQRIPVLNLSFDEQTGRAGVVTRLEAFIDMLWARRDEQRR